MWGQELRWLWALLLLSCRETRGDRLEGSRRLATRADGYKKTGHCGESGPADCRDTARPGQQQYRMAHNVGMEAAMWVATALQHRPSAQVAAL